MPELPEVETTRRGIEPHLKTHSITEAIVRDRRLRWPVPTGLNRSIQGQTVTQVERRAKYLLIRLEKGTLILHLGMSGSLRIIEADTPPQKHDHIDLILDTGKALRFHDPRRFGSLHWTREDPADHFLIADIGPEPLSNSFHGAHLLEKAKGRKVAVKEFIMNAKIVAGVGNIYANEALFRAGIHPYRAAGRISLARYEALAQAISEILAAAIQLGGTTLRDFVSSDGKPGYFAQSLSVYGRDGEACVACGETLKLGTRGQRATVFCPNCQR